MKKVGAWLMLVFAAVFALAGVLSGFNLIMLVLAVGSMAAESSELIGVLTGRLFVFIIILAIAWKLFTKGRSMLSGGASAPAEPKP